MFTVLCTPLGCLIVVAVLVIFLSSKDDTPADMPDPWRPFSQLALLAQQLCTSGPPLRRAVQAVSVQMSSLWSRCGPGGKSRLGTFNFGVVMGGGGEMNIVDMDV